MTSNTHQAAREVYQRIAANIAKIMQGQAGSTRKLLAALPEILRAFADWRLWSVAWLLVSLLLVVRGRTVLRAAAPRFVAWAALLPPAVGLLAYAVTPWGDVAGLVRVTWARFLLQGALPGLVLLALLLREPRDAGRSRVSRSA